uniref:disease resistance protein At4g27190 n=1 Tax=Erigeron canadensis TaxID=72917 RepID=UPI001CB98B3D|nr:disease resistance protein At4g27190 [Erigeron canadensis]
MEALNSVFVEGAKSFVMFTCSRIKTFSKYEKNVRELEEGMVSLAEEKREIEEQINIARVEERTPRRQVIKWLRKVSEVENAVRPLLERPCEYADGTGSSMLHQYQQCCKVAAKLELVKELNSTHFDIVAPERCSPVKAVEKMEVPPLVGQQAISDIKKLLEILNEDGVRRIAVLGMGGIGKTTLVKKLNNELEFSSPSSFEIVIWVQVSMATDLSTIQAQVAKRIHLKLDPGDAPHRIANKILRRLELKRKILLILDDVWKEIDLDAVGIPSSDPCCKVLITTRSRDVCRQMTTDVSFQLDLMGEEDAWNLFVQSAGAVLKLDGIEAPARKFVSGFHGLPLVIKSLGKSMRDRPQIELWQNAYARWRCSSPLFQNIENEVFGPLKMSYYFLPNKIQKQCFLSCSMYPGNFSINVRELIQCWVSDELINENQSTNDIFSDGESLVERLKDLSLLDQDSKGTVKMHDIYRRLAIILSQTQEMYGFHCQSGLPFYQTPNESSRRVSFMGCRMEILKEFPINSQVTVLFLQGNPIKKIPNEFFHNIRSLRVLNLSETRITVLPSSFICLGELRSLFLRGCLLQKLPSLENMSKLLVLDLSNSRIRELPEGFRSLSNLRELNLSCTRFLKKIVAGSISGLVGLETLDMSFSAYNWNPEMNSDQRATFEELLSLDRLSILQIRLDSVECLVSASSWLKKLRRFDIQISPRNCNLNDHVAEQNEKKLVLRGVDFSQENIRYLLRITSSLDMLTCVGMNQRHWLSLSSLISLTISNCDVMICLISSERSSQNMFPKLQHLILDKLKNLATTVEGILRRGRCLTNLKTVQISDCPMLKEAISYAMLRHVQKLEEIKVNGCENMSCIIASGEHRETLPNLRVLEISNMANLRKICEGESVFPMLQRVQVSGCSGLRKLPLKISNLSNLKEIRGDWEWWNNLEWEDDVKNIFRQHFQAYPRNTYSRKRRYK